MPVTPTAATATQWYVFEGIAQTDTPALVVYADRVKENIQKALALVGDPARLRPHFKTSKCAAICSLFIQAGITRFKCATVAEAELLAMNGAPDVLLAYQPVGPKVERLVALADKYPATRFSCLVDHAVPAKALAAAATRQAVTVGVYIDINPGMNRSGILPGGQAVDLYNTCSRLKGLELLGLHVYDGHLTQFDLLDRKVACDAAFAPIEQMRRDLEAKGFATPVLIAGGTPTLSIHAQYPDRECSPGTFVYWDGAYGDAYPDLPFLAAALVLTRVISLPTPTTITLDMGHKSIASENDLLHRFQLLNAPDALPIMHSEEHLVVRLPEGHGFAIGDVLFALPHHICPTVALHQQATVVEDGKLWGWWPTGARDRELTV